MPTSRKTWTISMEEVEAEETTDFGCRERFRLAPWQLLGICDPKHPLCALADSIDWEILLSEVAKDLPIKSRWPSRNLRLILGLVALSDRFDVDEAECISRFQENIYWQYFCGLREIQWKCEVEPMVLEKWKILLQEIGWHDQLNPPIRRKLSLADFGTN